MQYMQRIQRQVQYYKEQKEEEKTVLVECDDPGIFVESSQQEVIQCKVCLS